MKKSLNIVIILIFIFMLGVNSSHINGRLSQSEGTTFHDISGQRIVSSEIYHGMTVRLEVSLKPINGYSYGNFGIQTTFYAIVINGSGTYTYHWSVNSMVVKTITTSSNISSLTWNFTNPSEFFYGIYDFVNVTVTDSSTQSSSASYYGTFWYEPEIFVSVSGGDTVDTPGTMNITVSDWADVSPLNLTIFANGKSIYELLTPGWGGGFPISIKYNFTKTGVYNITVVAYDDSGQRIVSQVNVSAISHFAYDQNVFYNDAVNYIDDGTLFFLMILVLLLVDIVVAVKRDRK